MTKIATSGSCLCGAVSFDSRQLGTQAGACHCDICRRWGGGPLFALDGGNDVRFHGVDNITTYDTTAWAKRAFCRVCGSHLYIKVKEGGRYILPAGLFPVEDQLRFDHQIFMDSKPEYYSFANETRNLPRT